MLSKRALLCAMIALAAALAVNAQISTNSPYTRFGLGDLQNKATAGNAAMGGIGYGLRDKTMINTMNPASYTAVDSITMMMDIGMSFTNSNYKEAGWKTNAKNATFDYVTFQLRFKKWLGFAAGYRPYSNVGYDFYDSEEMEDNEDVTAVNSYTGEGGLHELFMGFGFRLFKNLSVGFNVGYLYGDIDYTATASFSVDSDYSLVYNAITVNTYNAEFGLQYTQPMGKKHSLTLGFVYGLGHDVNSSEVKGIELTDGSTYVNYNEDVYRDTYGIPETLGVGLVYNKGNNLTIGVDYEFQKWSDVIYNGEEGWYNDRKRISAGLEFMPSNFSKKYFERVRYRIGGYYTNSYLNLPTGYKGPKEYGISAGIGFPLLLYQKNSMLSITAQYVHFKSATPDLLSENRFVIKLGMTFNEHWFMKWKLN